MNVAIDVSPLESGHSVRGVGFYLENLKNALLKYYPDNKYHFFNDSSLIPNDYNIVHYPYFDPYFLSLPSKNSQKTVITVHDLTPIIFKEHFPAGIRGNVRWLIQKKRLRSADAIITDSESSKKDITKIVGIEEDKIKVIYLAAPDYFKKMETGNWKIAIEKKFNLPDEFILYVGDVTWNKNLPRIVEAVKKSNFKLVMVGKALINDKYDKSNPWNKDLSIVQKEIENDERFIRLGFVSNEDLNLLYNSASCLLMPSLYEGFGLPVIEAMQAGCPVITSKEGSLEEVAGDAALYTDPFNSDAIAESINKLMEDGDLRKRLSQKGIDRAKNFSWKKTAEETLKVYRELV